MHLSLRHCSKVALTLYTVHCSYIKPSVQVEEDSDDAVEAAVKYSEPVGKTDRYINMREVSSRSHCLVPGTPCPPGQPQALGSPGQILHHRLHLPGRRGGAVPAEALPQQGLGDQQAGRQEDGQVWHGLQLASCRGVMVAPGSRTVSQ